MRGRAVLLPVMCALMAWATAATRALGQNATAPVTHTEPNYIRVDVHATRAGQPVDDLRPEDFEVLEDGVPQTLDRAERIALASADRANPARRRVVVVFLDIRHVDGDPSRASAAKLADALGRLIGPDDLIAVARSDIAARDVTFEAGTSVRELLERYWWREEDRPAAADKLEERYRSCYPGVARPGQPTAPDQGIADEMIQRGREKQTLDVLEDLVVILRTVREERKAILVVSDGWRAVSPNGSLARPIDGVRPLGTETARPGPKSGAVAAGEAPDRGTRGRADCDFDRVALAEMDDQARLRAIADKANRSNAAIYAVDPRTVLDLPPSSSPSRAASLRTLADATDGSAIGGSAGLDAAVRRINEDLSAYYLLGYFSTGKLDGRFHALTVRVKRPDVQVRARRGYLASTGAAAEASVADANGTIARPDARLVADAIGSLEAFAREAPLRVAVDAGWTPAGSAIVRTIVEAQSGPARDAWSGGGDADAELLDKAGVAVGAAHATIDPGASSVELRLLSTTLGAGDYEVRVRTKGTGAPAAVTQSARIAVPASPATSGVIYIRRGPTTGNKIVPTADERFRRTERLLIDIATPSAVSVSARLLDRQGRPLPIPVAASLRDDADGTRWSTADLSLVPFAPGDYIIEVTSGADHTLAPFRVIP